MIFQFIELPIILYGLVIGAYNTYVAVDARHKREKDKQVERGTDKDCEDLLQFWVVFFAAMCLFPWLEWAASWIMMGGIVTIIKLVVLGVTAINTKGSGMVFKFVEESFIPWVSPYLNTLFLHLKDVLRTMADKGSIMTEQFLQLLLRTFAKRLSSGALEKLGKSLTKTRSMVQVEQDRRANKKKADNSRSIFEEVQDESPGASNLRQRKIN